MNNPDIWEEQPGGLLLSVQRFDKENPLHLETIVPAMRGTFAAISQKHGAEFAEQGMRNNLIALYTGRTTADIYYAKWHHAAQEICMGVAYGWKTYGITPSGMMVPAEYTEDIGLPMGARRQIVRAKPSERQLPDEGLAKIFERLNLQQMRERGTVYRFGEVDKDNTTMMRQLLDNGALIGDDVLLKIKRLPNNLLDTLTMNPTIEPIYWNGTLDEHNFLVTCAEHDTVVRSIMRLGQATALGKPRADLRIYQHGELLGREVTRCFINSTLFAAKIKGEDSNWGREVLDEIPDSVRPLLKANSAIAEAISPSKLNIISPEPPKTFCEPMPGFHVTAPNGNLSKGFEEIGFRPRFHGTSLMSAGTNVLHAGLG